MCAGGNVRSVALKRMLRDRYGHDCLCCGDSANTQETREMLYEWADYIITLADEYNKFIPEKYNHKLFCYNVGPDVFGYAAHPVLNSILGKIIEEHGLFNKTLGSMHIS